MNFFVLKFRLATLQPYIEISFGHRRYFDRHVFNLGDAAAIQYERLRQVDEISADTARRHAVGQCGYSLSFCGCHGGCFGLTCGYQEDAAGKGDGLQEGAAEKVHSYFKLVC